MDTPTVDELLARVERLQDQVETMQGTRRRTTRRATLRIVLSVVALAALLAVPIGVFASHQFTDVPDSNTFHTQIGRVKGAGITAGCTATKYCPADNVTRGQMAAFLARTGGRTVHDDFLASLDVGASNVTLATVSLKAGDVPGGTAYVKIDASLAGYTYEATSSCPCSGIFTVYVNGVASPAPAGGQVFVGIDSHNAGAYGIAQGSISTVVPVSTGVVNTITLRGSAQNGTLDLSVFGDLVATYVPFAGDGTNALTSVSAQRPVKGEIPPKP